MQRLACAAALVALPALSIAQSKPAAKPADFANWETLAGGTLAPHGQWLAYGVNRVNEENELRLTSTSASARDTTIAIPYATGPTFSTDSRWLAYTVGVSPAERDRLTKDKKPVRNSAGLRNLATGSAETTKDVTAFAFSRDGKHFAMRRYPAEGKRAADVIVQDLAAGTKLTFGNVSSFAWAEGAPLLAMTVESETGASNGVQLYDARTGALRSLDASPSLYRQLAWREKSTDLAVLRTRIDKGFRDTAHVVLAWTGLGTATTSAQRRTLDTATKGAPSGMRVAEHRRPEWAKDGSVILLGLRPREVAKPADTSRVQTIVAQQSAITDDTKHTNNTDTALKSDVQIWHAKDVRLMQQQKVQEQQDMQRTLLAAWHVAEERVVQIGTSLDETVTVLEGSRHATETDTKSYKFGAMFGRPYRDLYVVDVKTGERRKTLEKVRFTPGRSATGRKLLAFDGKDYWSYDVVTGARVNISGKTAARFVNKDYDTPTDMMPAYGVAGWTKDDSGVLAYAEFDVWLLAADGSGGRRLTDGARDSVVYRYAAVTSDATPGIDVSKPIYFSAFGKRTKQSGFARLRPGRGVERLVLEDARVGALRRADSTDVFVNTKERFDDSPDLFITGADLSAPTQRSKTNPQQAQFAWGRSELISFKSATGRDLQGVLLYPANHDPSKKYPMIVYTYELLSQQLHTYVAPSDRSYYNRTAWTAAGYFVLLPDIVFRAREPGMSALDAVVPAVRSVVARGLVDSARVGHIGHSWGGYEAAFLPTRTRIFAASVAGAAITNMLSFMGELHWGPGTAELSHWETGQARMEVPFWEDMEAYLRNSPVAKVHELRTPVLLMTGDNDGTVYWHQAVEYYNYARRAGREDVVMLVYPAEDHGLRKKENQIDYHRRINEWFGHYLKGEPAPRWITEGLSWADRKILLDSTATRRP
ncbi:MAG: prolyl oligopeptidase family serine peptidase [Gemmatimonadaceae bacterium]